MSIEELTVLSNIALVIVTAAAAWATLREGHRHEEHESGEMAAIVHEVLAQERRMEAGFTGRDDDVITDTESTK